MALDRSWYNTLVDDDGSGLTGSVWDKADVDSLMDAIDAEIARLDQAATTFQPKIESSGGGTPIYAWQAGDCVKRGQIVLVQFRVAISNRGSLSAAGNLYLGGLPYVVQLNGDTSGGLSISAFGGLATAIAWMSGYCPLNGTNSFILTAVGGGGAQSTTPLVLANITDSFAITGAVTYRTN